MAEGTGMPQWIRKLPWVTFLFAAAILFVAWQVTGFLPSESDVLRAAWTAQDASDGNWGRAVLAIFAHGGLLHLLVNLSTLLSLGPLVERRIGPLWYALVWFAAGLGSLLAHGLYRPDVPVVGASGSLFGLVGLLMVLKPRLRMQAFFAFEVSLLMFGALYAAIVPILLRFEVGAFIAHEAHLGGMVVGAIAAFVVEPKRALHVMPAALAVFVLVTLLVAAWVRFLSVVDCSIEEGVFRWLGCVASAFVRDTALLLGTLVGGAGISAAYAYLEIKQL